VIAELLGPLAVAGVMATAVVTFAVHRLRARLRGWHQAADQVGLEGIAQGARTQLFLPSLTGRSGALQVRFGNYRRGKYESGTRLQITGLGPGAETLTLRREGLGTQVFGREIEIGDPAFDAEVYVNAPAALALALLDHPTRIHLAALLRGEVGGAAEVRAALERGVLDIRLRDRALSGANAGQLAAVLRSALAVARRLALPADLAARLADNFRHEPEAGVRLQILLTLARELPDRPEARAMLLHGLEDASDEVRLRAAQALGPEGEATLRDLAADDATEDSCAARAVEAVGDRLTSAELIAPLAHALDAGAGRLRTALACLAALGRHGDPSTEEPLVRALQAGDPQIALAAAQALGRAGTVAAVAPLRTAADAVLPSALRSAARQAIAEIQARLPGAAPGQLALAGGDVGALSFAPPGPGELNLLADSEPLPRDEDSATPDPTSDPTTGSAGSRREAES
jgi:HEAT repeat protein